MELSEVRKLAKERLDWKPICAFLIREIGSVQFYGVNGSNNKLRAVIIYNKDSQEIEIIE